MHTTNELLDELARRMDGASDYRLAKVLHTSTSAITAYRKARRIFSPEFAMRVAERLAWPREYVLACVEHERVMRAVEGMRDEALTDVMSYEGRLLSTWKSIAQRFSPTGKIAQGPRRRAPRNKVAGLVLAAGISGFFAPSPSPASELGAPASVYYGKRRGAGLRGANPWVPARFPRRHRPRRRRAFTAPAALPVMC